MRKRTIARVLAVALVAALALGALAGCQSPATGATDQQQANRTYMTKVNQAVEELNTRLGEFDEAGGSGERRQYAQQGQQRLRGH